MTSRSTPTAPSPPPPPPAAAETLSVPLPPSETLLYFAYGSNLSTTQMAHRCPEARPIALGRLAGWDFIINARGFANIVPSTAATSAPSLSPLFPPPPPPVLGSSTVDARVGGHGSVPSSSSCSTRSSTTKEQADDGMVGKKQEASNTDNRVAGTASGLGVVYGLVYRLASQREKELLDGYEGVSVGAYEGLVLPIRLFENSSSNNNNNKRVTKGQREAERRTAAAWKWRRKHWLGKRKRKQKEGDLDGSRHKGGDNTEMEQDKQDGNQSEKTDLGLAWALVYVDPLRTSGAGEHQPRKEYVGRMNRGIREAVDEWGLPEDYVSGVLRRFIPEEE